MTICNHSRISSQITDPLCQKPATSLLRASRKWTFRKASTRNFIGRLAGELSSVDVAEGLASELSSVGVVEGLVDGLASAGGSDDGLSKPQVSLADSRYWNILTLKWLLLWAA
jgi:hypothetical protein